MVLEPSNTSIVNKPHPAFLGSYLQGVLMENIDSDYAGYLHRLSFNPYSQCCLPGETDGTIIWKINALTDEAAEHILSPLGRIDSFELRAVNSRMSVIKTSLEAVPIKALTDLITHGNNSKMLMRFLTPTAFKSQGSYIFMPSIRLIFQNLLMHYSAIYDGSSEADQDTVSYIEQHALISSYDIRSYYYPHTANGGKKIPGFIGKLTLSLRGPSAMVGLANMLMKFGEYAGLGIKTSMGMGGFSYEPLTQPACPHKE